MVFFFFSLLCVWILRGYHQQVNRSFLFYSDGFCIRRWWNPPGSWNGQIIFLSNSLLPPLTNHIWCLPPSAVGVPCCLNKPHPPDCAALCCALLWREKGKRTALRRNNSTVRRCQALGVVRWMMIWAHWWCCFSLCWMLTHGPLWLGVDPLCGQHPSGSGGQVQWAQAWTAGLWSVWRSFSFSVCACMYIEHATMTAVCSPLVILVNRYQKLLLCDSKCLQMFAAALGHR